MKLSKEEWDQLDKLLSKCGFGGYYDLVECLKQSILDVNKKTTLFKENKIQQTTDLGLLVKVLNRNTQKLNEA